MERHQILEMTGELKPAGMRHAYDHVIADAVNRQHPAPRVVSDLLTAEITEKQARSIKCPLTTAKLPLAKEIAGIDFADTPVNEPLVRELATGGFVASQRNAVLAGGTGTGKTHFAIAIGRACVRTGARVRFFNTVDLINRLKARARVGPGAPARSSIICRGLISSSSTHSAIYCSPCQASSCCSIRSAGFTNRPRSSSPPTWRSANGCLCSATPR